MTWKPTVRTLRAVYVMHMEGRTHCPERPGVPSSCTWSLFRSLSVPVSISTWSPCSKWNVSRRLWHYAQSRKSYRPMGVAGVGKITAPPPVVPERVHPLTASHALSTVFCIFALWTELLNADEIRYVQCGFVRVLRSLRCLEIIKYV